MIIITVIFYLLMVLGMIYLCFFKRTKTVEKIDVSKVDVQLKDVNAFIKRETLYNFVSWFNSKITVKNMSNSNQSPSLITDLKDPEIIKTKMNAISSYIFITMSSALKASFYAVYNKNAYNDPDEMLTTYISRHVMFYIRKVNVDITQLFQEHKEETTENLLKVYIMTLENEIYKNNNIAVIEEEKDITEENNAEKA